MYENKKFVLIRELFSSIYSKISKEQSSANSKSSITNNPKYYQAINNVFFAGKVDYSSMALMDNKGNTRSLKLKFPLENNMNFPSLKIHHYCMILSFLLLSCDILELI